MRNKEQQRHIRGLISETLTLLCKSGLTYKANFSIEALIGITLDDNDVILVNINENVKGGNKDSSGTTTEVRHSGSEVIDSDDSQNDSDSASAKSPKKQRKRKRKRSRDATTTTPAKQSKPTAADTEDHESDNDFAPLETDPVANDDANNAHAQSDVTLTRVKTEPTETSSAGDLVVVKQEHASPGNTSFHSTAIGQARTVAGAQPVGRLL